jgi:drug/metabolite transporter (DMT)-like permease
MLGPVPMTTLPPPAALQPGLRLPLLPLALLALLGSLWGFAFSLVKIAALAGVPPLAFVFWQSLGAGAILLAFAHARGAGPPLSRIVVFYALGTGLLGLALPSTNAAAALRHIPAGLMAVIVAVTPLATAAFSRAVGFEHLGKRRVGGLLLGLAGTLLIVLPRASLPTPEIAHWALVALATPLLYAACNVFIARFRPAGIDSVALAAGMLVAASLCLGPAMVATGSWHPLWRDFGAGEAAILGQMAITALAYVIWFEVLRLAGPVFSSQVGYVVTATGLAWAMLLFDERYSLSVWAAVLLIAAGVALVARRT